MKNEKFIRAVAPLRTLFLDQCNVLDNFLMWVTETKWFKNLIKQAKKNEREKKNLALIWFCTYGIAQNYFAKGWQNCIQWTPVRQMTTTTTLSYMKKKKLVKNVVFFFIRTTEKWWSPSFAFVSMNLAALIFFMNIMINVAVAIPSVYVCMFSAELKCICTSKNR